MQTPLRGRRPDHARRRRFAALLALAMLSTGLGTGFARPTSAEVGATGDAPVPPGVHLDSVPAGGHWDPLPPADMTDWYAVPVLRQRTDGKAAVPGLDVIDLAAHGLTPTDLTSRGVTAVPFAAIEEWTNERIAASGVSSDIVDEIVPDGPSPVLNSVPTGSTLPISVYYDQSQLNAMNGQSTANNAWSRAVSLYQTQLNIPINRVRLLMGASVPISDVTTYCQMQTLARSEMGFASYGRALVIVSGGTIDGNQGIAIGGDVTETYSHGDSYNYCGDANGRPYITPAVIPPVYVSGFMDTWVPTLEFGKTGVDYVMAHELGHVLTMAHNMGRCWWDSSGLHLHKTLEAFTSGPTRPECGSNANSASHYHWWFNDNYNPAVGEAGINGHEAMTGEWDRFANCQASGWCTTNATPSAPRNVVATPGDRSVTLTWDPPTYQGGAPVQGYCYYYGTSPTFLTDSGWCTSSPAVVPNLTNGVRYYFYVRANNGQVGGQGGPRSSYVSAVPAVQNNLTSTTPTSYPSSLTPGQTYQICWSVSGSGQITHSEINWGTTSALGNLSGSLAGIAPAQGCTTLTAPSSGTVYFRSQATGPANTVNSAILTIPVNTPAQNDCGTGGDAGGTHATATSISLPKSNCSAALSPSTDTEDWYQFSVTSGQTISASITNNASSDFDVCIYNPSGSLVAGCSVGTTGGTDALTHGTTATGNYRVRVLVFSGTGSYTMSVSTTTPPPAQNDCGIGGDAGGSHAAAASISLPKSNCSGSLTVSTDVEDWYQFSVTSGQSITTSMTPNASSDFDVCLYNPSGASVGCSAAGTGGTDGVTYTADSTGSWRFRIYIYGSSPGGSYTMSVSTSGGGGGGPVTIRDDDGIKDLNLPMNYGDDTAVKRLNVTSTQLSGKTSATLYVYGQSYACSGTGNRFRLVANGSALADLNPCNEWNSTGFSWRAFSVPISWLFAGTNSFRLDHLAGDWTARNVYLGIDSSTDYGRTDAAENGVDRSGELMWYLVLS